MTGGAVRFDEEDQMAQRMADRLSAARRRGFVGRTAELEMFTALIRPVDPTVAVLFVHGPAGVGKSTLLRRFADLCDESDVAYIAVDALDMPPTIDALQFRLAPLLAGEAPTRTVILLDTYELLADIDSRVRDEIAPRLPADTLLIIAGQYPPSPLWRTDPGWTDLVQVVKLRNLSRTECGAYLSSRGIAAHLHEGAVEFTHGHPLALALVGEVISERGAFTPGQSTDVIKDLVGTLVRAAPTPTHRRALEASAQVRVITEPLLAALLDVQEAADLFDWLRGLPFVDPGPNGLHLHELASTVLAEDLRWRHPDRYVDLHSRARQYYLGRLEGADPAAHAAGLMDLMYLHTDLRRILRDPETGAAPGRSEAARPADIDDVAAMVERHEGPASAALARHWFAEQPEAWFVIRDQTGRPAGVVCLLSVQAVDAAFIDDPAVVAARHQLRSHAPLRPGERVTLVRFWMSRDEYQSVSPVQSVITTQLLRHYLTTPGLAVSLVPFAHPADWAQACAYTDQRRAPDADFTVAERTYASFVHDWRVVTPAAWVAALAAREIGGQHAEIFSPPTLLVLDENEFRAAVKRALRDLGRPDRLRENPLLRSRLVTGRVGDAGSASDRIAALAQIIRDAVADLAATSADKRLARVLYRAYLAPAPTLERAAEVLDLPSSTFRRLLTAGVGRVSDTLWHRELDV